MSAQMTIAEISAAAKLLEGQDRQWATAWGKADAEKTIVANLKAGKGHPAVKTSDADTTTLVKYILAM